MQGNGNRGIKCRLIILSESSLVAAIITGDVAKSPTPQASHTFVHLYSHKKQLQKQEIKKNKRKKTHNVLKMHTNYSLRKRKITSSTQS